MASPYSIPSVAMMCKSLVTPAIYIYILKKITGQLKEGEIVMLNSDHECQVSSGLLVGLGKNKGIREES